MEWNEFVIHHANIRQCRAYIAEPYVEKALVILWSDMDQTANNKSYLSPDSPDNTMLFH